MDSEPRAAEGNASWKRHISFLVGIYAAASPIPFFLVSCFWAMITAYSLYYATQWLPRPVIIPLAMFPFAISPICCCACLVYGIIRHREHLSWLCILLSILGLAENALLLYGMYFGGHW